MTDERPSSASAPAPGEESPGARFRAPETPLVPLPTAEDPAVGEIFGPLLDESDGYTLRRWLNGYAWLAPDGSKDLEAAPHPLIVNPARDRQEADQLRAELERTRRALASAIAAGRRHKRTIKRLAAAVEDQGVVIRRLSDQQQAAKRAAAMRRKSAEILKLSLSKPEDDQRDRLVALLSDGFHIESTAAAGDHVLVVLVNRLNMYANTKGVPHALRR